MTNWEPGFISLSVNMKDNGSDVIPLPVILMDYGPDIIPLTLDQRIVYYIIAGLGILGNSVAMYVLAYMVKSGCGNTNILLINQSLIDLVASVLLVLCFLMPQPSLTTTSTGWFVCFVWNPKYLFWATTVTSTFNLLCLTYERYYAIIHPLKYQTRPWLVWPRSVVLVLLPWFGGFLFESNIMVTHYIKDNHCKLRHFNDRIAYSVALVTLTYLVPLALMVFAYVRIYQAIREQPLGNISTDQTPLTQLRQLSAKNKHARRNIIKTLIIVCTTFALCWLPNQVLFTYYNINNFKHFDVMLYGVTVCIALLNMCANPFIYTLQYRGFRQGLLKAIPCLKKFQFTRNAFQEET